MTYEQYDKKAALLILNELVPRLSEQEFERLLKTLENKDPDMFIKREEPEIVSSGNILFKKTNGKRTAHYYGDYYNN